MKWYFFLVFFILSGKVIFSQDTYRIRVDLGDVILWAEEMLQDFEEGSNPGQVPSLVYWDLEEEVTRATYSYNNFDAEFDELYYALENLSNKGYEFLGAIITPDEISWQEYSELRTKADSLLEYTSVGNNAGQYPVVVYFQLLQAVAEGEKYAEEYNNISASQLKYLYNSLFGAIYFFELMKEDGSLNDSVQVHILNDTTALMEGMLYAEFVLLSSEIGNDVGQFPEHEYRRLSDTLSFYEFLITYKYLPQEVIDYAELDIIDLVENYILKEITPKERIKQLRDSMILYEYGNLPNELPEILESEVQLEIDAGTAALDGSISNDSMVTVLANMEAEKRKFDTYLNTQEGNTSYLLELVQKANNLLEGSLNDGHEQLNSVFNASLEVINNPENQHKINAGVDDLYTAIKAYEQFSVGFQLALQKSGIYPIPFTSSIIVEEDEAVSLVIVDAKGRTCFTENVQNGSRIDTGNLPIGAYYFIIQKESGNKRTISALKK